MQRHDMPHRRPRAARRDHQPVGLEQMRMDDVGLDPADQSLQPAPLHRAHRGCVRPDRPRQSIDLRQQPLGGIFQLLDPHRRTDLREERRVGQLAVHHRDRHLMLIGERVGEADDKGFGAPGRQCLGDDQNPHRPARAFCASPRKSLRNEGAQAPDWTLSVGSIDQDRNLCPRQVTTDRRY